MMAPLPIEWDPRCDDRFAVFAAEPAERARAAGFEWDVRGLSWVRGEEVIALEPGSDFTDGPQWEVFSAQGIPGGRHATWDAAYAELTNPSDAPW
jgi:hypothetical protein